MTIESYPSNSGASSFGSLEGCHLLPIAIGIANQANGSKVERPVEIASLVGTFSSSYAHLHLSVADGRGVTAGGHLLDGTLVYTTAEIVIVELTDLSFLRETDPAYGFKELVIRSERK